MNSHSDLSRTPQISPIVHRYLKIGQNIAQHLVPASQIRALRSVDTSAVFSRGGTRSLHQPLCGPAARHGQSAGRKRTLGARVRAAARAAAVSRQALEGGLCTVPAQRLPGREEGKLGPHRPWKHPTQVSNAFGEPLNWLPPSLCTQGSRPTGLPAPSSRAPRGKVQTTLLPRVQGACLSAPHQKPETPACWAGQQGPLSPVSRSGAQSRSLGPAPRVSLSQDGISGLCVFIKFLFLWNLSKRPLPGQRHPVIKTMTR